MPQSTTQAYKEQDALDRDKDQNPREDENVLAGRRISLPNPRNVSRLKVKQAKLIMFTTQLSIMLDSGVVLSDALDAISEQTEVSPFQTLVIDIAETVKSGETFSNTLSRYPRIFNSMFISMVKASEAS